MRSVRRSIAIAAIAFVFVTLLPATWADAQAQEPVPAQQNDDFATVEVDVLGSINSEPGQPVDVQVTISSRRAVSGTLLVIDEPFGGAPTTWEFDVDQAAGTQVAIPLVLTSSWEGLNATVQLESGGELIAEDDIRRFPDGSGDTAIVVTLGIEEPPRQLSELGTGEQLDVVVGDSNPTVLTRASTVITTPIAVRELAGSAPGEALEAWVRGGGQLVVDGANRSLDDRWHQLATGDPARHLFGAGSVLYSEDWEAGVPIGGYTGQWSLRRLVEEQRFGFGAAGELAFLADVGLPRPRLVSGVLLGYALLAGPLLYFFISRREQHRRIWLLLPAIAAAVTIGILAVGFLNGRGRTDAHITIVEVSPAGSRATSNVLIGSQIGNTRELTTPSSWRYLGQNFSGTTRAVRLRPEAAATRVAVDLPPSGNATMGFTGPADGYDGMLRIENIRRDNAGDFVADVVNASGVDLTSAIGFLGNERVSIGDIGAGQTATFILSNDGSEGRMMRELLTWPRVGIDWGPNGPVARPSADAESAVSAGAWTEWRIAQGTGAIPDHVIGVAAWTDELEAPIGDISLGNTALFVRAALPADVLGDDWISSSYEPIDQQQAPMMRDEFFGWAQNFRFTQGPGVDPDDLTLRVGFEAGGVSVLVDDVWQHAKLPESNGRQSTSIALPPGLEPGADIIAQAWVAEWHWNAGRTLWLEASAQADAAQAEWSTTANFRITEGAFFEPEFDGAFELVDEVAVEGFEPGFDADFDGDVGFRQYAGYFVELDADEMLIATLRGDGGDALLELHGPDGEVLAVNDDFGGSLDSRIEFVSVEPILVEVRAQGLGGEPLRYTLTLESPE